MSGVDSTFGHGYLFFATSDTIDPTGTWTGTYFLGDDLLIDYTAPGTSTDKFAFASNLFSMTAAGSCLSPRFRRHRCHGHRLGRLAGLGPRLQYRRGFWRHHELLAARRGPVAGHEQSPACRHRSGRCRPRGGRRVLQPDRHREHEHLHRIRRRPDDRRGHRSVPPATSPEPARTRHDRGCRRQPPHRCDLAEQPPDLRVDLPMHADRRFHDPRLRPGQPARHDRCQLDRQPDPGAGLPHRRERQGQLHGRRGDGRQRHPPRRVEQVVRRGR